MSLVSLILLLVLVGVVVRLVAGDAAPALERGAEAGSARQLEALREQLDDVSARLRRLEEERDFYKELLDAPDRSRIIEGPDDSRMGGADPSEERGDPTERSADPTDERT